MTQMKLICDRLLVIFHNNTTMNVNSDCRNKLTCIVKPQFKAELYSPYCSQHINAASNYDDGKYYSSNKSF